MTTEQALFTRSDSKCETCGASDGLVVFVVSPRDEGVADNCVLLCATCTDQIKNADKIDVHHWRCLTTSAWSQTPAVQVVAWRMLSQLRGEGWALELLDTLYLDGDTLAWAKDGFQSGDDGEEVAAKHLDAHGAELASGDAVTLIKDLNVKGAGFTAKRGTIVRNISLVANNPKHIEGRVNNQQIVILTEFVKKSN
ncbi:MAG: PhnA domain-containing protein [Marinicaulis sp.]|nr:PhnA domain-containing protein [Marinicaulis sp.]